MSANNAISFCEILHVLDSDVEKNVQLITSVQKEAKFETLDRIYLGSNFCCRYFIRYIFDALSKVVDCVKLQSFSHIKITLCVPIFSQTYLSQGKEAIQRIVEQYGNYVDEITVNDYGMLDYVCNKLDVKVNVGRLLNKDTRDIRHDEYFNASHVPATSTLSSCAFDNYTVNLYEMDVTNRFIDLTDSDKQFAFHYPYCYATVGNVCEFAGINQPIQRKFRANAPCDYSCTQVSIDYQNPRGDKYLKLGRAVYFYVEDFAVKTKHPYRLVYEPYHTYKPGEGK